MDGAAAKTEATPARASDAAVVVRAVDKAYATAQGPLRVLDGVSLSVARGESVALTGESGSGKSTLLHLIAGLDKFDAGSIVVGGKALETLDDAGRAAMRRDAVGVVFQQFNLVPSLRVGD
ncbi:MAG: ATP-binding cassette domain-containing protein, partial [Pseudomonadota bacterium]